MDNPSRAFFQRYYADAKRYDWPLPVAEEVDRVCRKLWLRPNFGDQALDFGCGEGRNTRYLADLGYRVTATDVIPAAVEITTARLAGRQADVRLVALEDPLPFPAAAFRLILAFHVLQWLGSREAFVTILRDFRRLLAPGGHLILTMPTETHMHTATGAALGEDVYRVTTPQRAGCVQYSPPLPTLRALLGDLGWTLALFGRHEFGYEGDENSPDCRLAMYVFGLR